MHTPPSALPSNPSPSVPTCAAKPYAVKFKCSRDSLLRAESKTSITGLINARLGINDSNRHKVKWFKAHYPEEPLALKDLPRSAPLAAKEAVEKLAAHVTAVTGQSDPVVLLKMDSRMLAEVQEAWQPHVVEFQQKHIASCKGARKAIKQTSPSKENEHENKNENGKKGESLSFSSPLRVAPQLTLTNSTERRVSHPPAPLPSLTSPSSPPPNLFPSQAYLLSFAHPSPSPVQISSVIFEFIAEQLEWLDKAMQRMLEEHASSIKAMIQDRNDKVLQAFAEQRAIRAMYAAELEKEKAERVAEKAEREKADAALHEILAEREKASSRLDVTREIIRLLKAELEAERNAKEELEAKNAELEEEIAEMKERITARKLKKEAAI